MTLSEQATAFLTGKLDQYTTETPRYTTGDYDLNILKLAKGRGPGLLSNKVDDFIRGQLVKFNNPSNGYDIELIKFAMNY